MFFDFPLGVFVGLVAGIGFMCALHISGCQSCIAHHLGEKEGGNETKLL
jgi:hypothetical protein